MIYEEIALDAISAYGRYPGKSFDSFCRSYANGKYAKAFELSIRLLRTMSADEAIVTALQITESKLWKVLE